MEKRGSMEALEQAVCGHKRIGFNTLVNKEDYWVIEKNRRYPKWFYSAFRVWYRDKDYFLGDAHKQMFRKFEPKPMIFFNEIDLSSKHKLQDKLNKEFGHLKQGFYFIIPVISGIGPLIGFLKTKRSIKLQKNDIRGNKFIAWKILEMQEFRKKVNK